MKKIETLKLNSLSASDLKKREMNSLHGGGEMCACQCNTQELLTTPSNFSDIFIEGCLCGCGCSSEDARSFLLNSADDVDDHYTNDPPEYYT